MTRRPLTHAQLRTVHERQLYGLRTGDQSQTSLAAQARRLGIRSDTLAVRLREWRRKMGYTVAMGSPRIDVINKTT